MTKTTLNKTIFLKASREQVWAYLTEPDKLARWFHKPETTITEGEFAMYGTESGEKLIWGEVTVSKPYETLEYTFSVKPMNGASSLVKWTLEEVPGGTRLSLVHEGLPENEEAFGLVLALDKGWDDHLGRMRQSIHDA